MLSRKSFLVLPLVAAGALCALGFAQADEPAKPAPASEPAAAAAPAQAPSTKSPEATEPETKTGSPIHTMMFWVGSQVAPNLETPCPATPEGEKAWRGWFAGGADVPLAGLRDRMIADGWTADRFVSFFSKMAKSSCCEGGKECDEECGDECCEGEAKGECCKGDPAAQAAKKAEGKGCCGKCPKGETSEPASAPAKP
jgi:hypothetical protein